MEHFTPQQRVEVIKTFYINNRSIAATQKHLRNLFDSNNVPSKTTIQDIVKKFETQCTLLDKVKSEPESSVSTEEIYADYTADSPVTPSTNFSIDLEAAPENWYKILKKNLTESSEISQAEAVESENKKTVQETAEKGGSVGNGMAANTEVSKTTKGRSKKAGASAEVKNKLSQEVKQKKGIKKPTLNALEEPENAIGQPVSTLSKGRKRTVHVTSEGIEFNTQLEKITISEEKAIPPKKRTYAKKTNLDSQEVNAGEKTPAVTQRKSKNAKSEKPIKIKLSTSKTKKAIEKKSEITVAGRGKKRVLKAAAAAAENGEEESQASLNGVNTKNETEKEAAEGLRKKRGDKAGRATKALALENTGEVKQVGDEKKISRERKRPAVTSPIDSDQVDGTKPSKSKKAPPINSTETTYKKADFLLEPTDEGGDCGKEKRFNLKICSWNVAGLRSWIKKDGLRILDYEDPDIFCLQETKCTTDQMPEEAARIPGYHPYWLCNPGGYAGVAIYSKIMPIHVEYGIGNAAFDEAGRIITAEYEKFFLVCTYVPNSGRKLVNLEQRMRWEELFQAFVKKLDARKPVIICGDMNVSHKEIDLANPKANTRNAGFTKEEREKMTELLELGFVDTFRHLYPNQIGAYTFWTYMGNARSRNVGWRLDYFLVSQRFNNRVVDSCIRSQVKGSDHCPITLFLNL